MVALGMFLLALSGLLTAAMIVQNTEPSTASVFGQAVSGVTVGGLFAAGVATGIAALIGLTLILTGARRGKRRASLKREVRSVRGEKETLEEENARLQAELEAARSGVGGYPQDAGSAELDQEGTDGRADQHRAAAGGKHGLFRH